MSFLLNTSVHFQHPRGPAFKWLAEIEADRIRQAGQQIEGSNHSSVLLRSARPNMSVRLNDDDLTGGGMEGPFRQTMTAPICSRRGSRCRYRRSQDSRCRWRDGGWTTFGLAGTQQTNYH